MAGWACALIGERGWRLIDSEDRAEHLAVLAVAKHACDARREMNREQARLTRTGR